MSLSRAPVTSTNVSASRDQKVLGKLDDTISSINWSPVGTYYVAASWDKKVRVYQVSPDFKSKLLITYEHDAPVLCAKFSLDGSKIVSGGGDNRVVQYDLNTGAKTVIGTHDGPVSCLEWASAQPPILATGSWDKSIKYWDLSQQKLLNTVTLPSRVYKMASSQPLMVAALADKTVAVFNLANPFTVLKIVKIDTEVGLKCIAAISTPRLGFLVGTADGKVILKFVEELPSDRKMEIRAHGDGTRISAVNGICIHPHKNYFITAGSDSAIHFWEKERMTKVGYMRLNRQLLTAASFDCSGVALAYASGYDWCKGYQGHQKNIETIIQIHEMKEGDLPKTIK